MKKLLIGLIAITSTLSFANAGVYCKGNSLMDLKTSDHLRTIYKYLGDEMSCKDLVKNAKL